jgi:heme exporter protein A
MRSEYVQHDIPQPPALEIRGLRKAYGRVAVLRDLDLDLRWGEVLTVLGPNGSGKTTLISIIATLARADRGTVRVAGLDHSRTRDHVRRLIGVVTHEPLLYDDLTAYENLRFVAQMYRLDRAGERIAAMAERLGVAARLHQRVGTLSHGLRRRFTIARALLHDPVILLMDEPESGLDLEAQAILDAIIRDRAGPVKAVLMTTHSVERAIAVGDRLAILSRGGIVHQGPLDSDAGVDAIKEHYARHTGATS